MIMVYKMMTGKIRIKREDLFTLDERESRGHSLKICKNKRASMVLRPNHKCLKFIAIKSSKRQDCRRFQS